MGIAQPPDDVLAKILSSGETPRLMLHCCCAPCASYVLEYLSPVFDITLLYFNPNIKPREEYDKRAGECVKLLELTEYPNCIETIACDYEPSVFDAAATGLWDEPEGGLRCRVCFEIRLRETAQRAHKGGFEYFATTLTVSPHKNADLINEIGAGLAGEYGSIYLPSDFKKRDGYKRSIELSKRYGLYRQQYCGCHP